MKEILKAFLTLKLKEKIKKEINLLLSSNVTEQAEQIFADSIVYEIMKAEENKIWLLNLIDKFNRGEKIIDEQYEKYARLRHERMCLLEEILEDGYDSVATSRLNTMINEGWTKLRGQYVRL